MDRRGRVDEPATDLRRGTSGRILASISRVSTRLEVLIGRSLAAIVHPYAAWRVHSSPVRRLLLLAGYSTIGYVTVLTTLLAL
jgi:hypothetical protein